MLEPLRLLFDTTGFPPRWHCGAWSDFHGWAHILSDLAIWSAYLAIPIVLVYFARRRENLPFRYIFLFFGAFILACGTTHLMESIIFWKPAYRLAGLIKVITAAVSWATVFALARIMPEALAMKSPKEQELSIAARTSELKHEIAQRVRAEEALRGQREILRVTLGSIGDGVIATDHLARVTFMNAVAEQLTGWKADEALSQPLAAVFEIIHEKTRAPAVNPCERVLRDGVVVGLANHTVLISKDMREIPIDDSAAPIRDREGKIFGVVLVFRDATKQRAYVDSQERLAAIVADSYDAIIGHDLDGRITSWNRAAEHLFGYPAAEAVGQSIEIIVPPDRKHEIEQSMARLRSGQPAEHLETIRRCKDGTLLEVSNRTSPIRNAEGEVIGASKRSHDISERKRAESLLQSQRELLQVTLSSIGDGVIATDREGKITFINRVAAELSGWSHEESQGLPLESVFRIVNERTHQPVEAPTQKVMREGTVVGLANHTLLIAKNGREIPIDDSAAPIRDREGKILGVVLVFRDATQQRAYVDLKERLAAIVEHSHDAIIGQDMQGVITNWNKAAEDLYGYPAEEALGRSIEMLMPPERKHEFRESIERLGRGEREEHGDTIRIRKDGTRIEVGSRVSPIRNAEGEVIGAAMASREISERKRSERTFQFLASAGKSLSVLNDYQSTLDRVAHISIPFFSDWCIVEMVNHAGQIEHASHAHIDPEMAAPLQAALNSSSGARGAGIAEYVVERGKPLLLSDLSTEPSLGGDKAEKRLSYLAPIHPRSMLAAPIVIRGKVAGVVEFGTSDSGRHYHEADVHLAIELAHRAAIAIENAQLYQEIKEAQRQKDDFLAMLAHELRNPLAAIQYANEVSKYLDKNDDTSANVIDKQVKNLAHLIDDLLDVSRITRDKIKLNKEVIDGAAVVRRAVATVRPAIEGRRHELALDISDKPMPLYADAIRVEQIIDNLLSNAAKYTPEGGKITVRCYPSGGEAVFTIEDTGIGIPPAMLPRVFELFTQVDQTLDRSEGGLGIGLTVVRKLAEMHGGSVSAKSEGLGCGSQFTLRLPLTELTAQPPSETPGTHAASAPLKILVVDDNVDTARSLAILLKTAGHTTTMAHDGHAAVETARSFHPDVVLLDIGLPGIDGYRVAQALRGESQFDKVLLVALSGYGQPEDRKRAKDAGFDNHLVKPVDFQQLLGVIGKWQAASGQP